MTGNRAGYLDPVTRPGRVTGYARLLSVGTFRVISGGWTR